MKFNLKIIIITILLLICICLSYNHYKLYQKYDNIKHYKILYEKQLKLQNQ